MSEDTLNQSEQRQSVRAEVRVNEGKFVIYMCVCGEQEEDLRDQKNVLVHEKRQ